jgi:hypothetical protein
MIDATGQSATTRRTRDGLRRACTRDEYDNARFSEVMQVTTAN